MRSCPNCRNPLADEQFQCDRCGMVVSQPFCFTCRAPIENIEDHFCTNCGAPFSMPFGIPYFQMTEAGEAPEAGEPVIPEEAAVPGYTGQAPDNPAGTGGGEIYEPFEPVRESVPAEYTEPEMPVPENMPVFPAEGTGEMPGYGEAYSGEASEGIPEYQQVMPETMPEDQPVIPDTVPEYEAPVPEDQPVIPDTMPEYQAPVPDVMPAFPPPTAEDRRGTLPEVVSYRDFVPDGPEEEEPEKPNGSKKKKWIIIACCALAVVLAAAAALLLLRPKPGTGPDPGNTTTLLFRTATPEPTVVPTPETTATAVPEETAAPTPETTPIPTPEPTAEPTAVPTDTPSPEPTPDPTPEEAATAAPDATASPEPEAEPTEKAVKETEAPEDRTEEEELPEEPEDDGAKKAADPETAGEPAIANKFPVLAKTTIKKVNVRSRPDQNGRRMQYINDPGTIVTLLGKKKDKAGNTWYQIKLANGSTGYINAKYAVPESAGDGDWDKELDAQEHQYPFTAVTTKKKVILRFKPDSKSRRVTYINRKGTQVTVLEGTADKQGIHWYKVRLENGTTGYAQSEYFTQE